MNRTKWFFHPIFIFILSIVALATSLFLYIYWYVEVSTGLKSVVNKFNLDSSQVLEPQTWIVIMVLSILVGIILLGIFIIFVYNQKTLQLYRLQYNFINNFTHELKTPVTSLKLFLQTFSKHELSRDDQLKYIQYMIADVSTLSDHISRILNLARIESKSYKKEFIVSDLVEAFEQFYKNNDHLFKGCKITIHHPPE
ncbi:MAG: sensor histidine kinase, partial [Deltaproteobacteria bacterium]|nr:sensor histidine kinase [Deltaproteobacteria bacterium]